jgi:predicted ATP-grasp superfamily ATP-dependent carboligase
VLITSSEGTISVIRRHREQLEQRVHIALAREPALGIALNKERTLKVAQELGLGVPRGVAVCSVSEVPAALREIGLPAVVKPVESWSRGEKQGIRVACQLVTTPDEAYCAVEELTRFGGSILFQQFLFGNGEDQVCPLQPGQYWISSFLSSLQWDIPISMRRTLFRPGRQLWGLLVICSGK